MGKKTFAMFVCSIALMMFVSTLNGQGSKKTITLPNGEVVWDLNGEWDVFIENYGNFAYYGSYPNVYKITQNGSSFTGIRLKDNPPPSSGRAGTKSVQGELDKNGFKRFEIISSAGGIIPSKGQISEDGNKISIDAPNYARQTYTRK
jgi:hypothetical protein